MIVMGDRAWTLAVLHLACAMSRRNEAEVVILKMVPVRHPLQLGSTPVSMDLTREDITDLADVAATAEDYGVFLNVQICHYANYWHAVADSARQLQVTAVLVHIPPTPLPFWRNFRRWLLRYQLARQHQLLVNLEDFTPSLTWTPSITLQNDMARRLGTLKENDFDDQPDYRLKES